MTETVVHVTTLSQWHNVLDILFKQGYSWNSGRKEYKDIFFKEDMARYLQKWPDFTITYISGYSDLVIDMKFIEHYEFMAQQKEDNKMATYYVTQEQLDLIEWFNRKTYPALSISQYNSKLNNVVVGFNREQDKALLRYLGGDETIEFKVQEQLYRLWRMETNDRIYMRINDFGTPIWTVHKDNAFTAPLEKIKKWQTPAWSVEEVK